MSLWLPMPLVAALDHWLVCREPVGGRTLTRAQAVLELLDRAVEHVRGPSKLRVLRYLVLTALRGSPGSGGVLAEDLRRSIPSVPRELLDRTVLDLERDGLVSLHADATCTDGIDDPVRGLLGRIVLRMPASRLIEGTQVKRVSSS